MLVLAIESSCDETAAAVVRDGREILSSIIASQIELHRPFGGVFPELAAREHLDKIDPVVKEAIAAAGIEKKDLDAVAVTQGPGLIGSLLVGVSYAKAFAFGLGIPFIGVNHIEGHVYSVAFENPPVEYPALALIVSGGHTNLFFVPEEGKYKVVSRTRDDAAGEAFDKTAKVLGFPYPGGRWIDETAAQGGNPAAFDFPRALPQKATLDFSFSGLKTAVALKAEELRKAGTLEARLPDLCASTQEAIVDALYAKISLAVRENRCQALAIVGGVAANSRLRDRLANGWKALGLVRPPILPEMTYCTDNAAMIAGAGAFRFRQGHFLRLPDTLTLNAFASPEF